MCFILSRKNTYELQFTNSDDEVKHNITDFDYHTLISNIHNTKKIIIPFHIFVSHKSIEKILPNISLSLDFKHNLQKRIGISVTNIECHKVLWRYKQYYNDISTKTIMIDKQTIAASDTLFTIQYIDGKVTVIDSFQSVNLSPNKDVYEVIVYYTCTINELTVILSLTVSAKIQNDALHITNMIIKPYDIIFKEKLMK